MSPAPPPKTPAKRKHGRRHGFAVVEASVVEALPRLPASAVRLAVALGRFADGDGCGFPSSRMLQAVAGIRDWRTFTRARAELARCGLAWKPRGQRLQYYWTDPPPAQSGPPVTATGKRARRQRGPAPIAATGKPPSAMPDDHWATSGSRPASPSPSPRSESPSVLPSLPSEGSCVKKLASVFGSVLPSVPSDCRAPARPGAALNPEESKLRWEDLKSRFPDATAAERAKMMREAPHTQPAAPPLPAPPKTAAEQKRELREAEARRQKEGAASGATVPPGGEGGQEGGGVVLEGTPE